MEKGNIKDLIKVIDFWQKSALQNDLYDRAVLGQVDLMSKEIRDFVGPRRSGKSSILKLIIKRLQLHDNFLYVNFEDPFFIENNTPQIIEGIIETFQEHFHADLKYIFFDEIQEITHWEKALRKLRDGSDFRVFITGSSSKLLSREMASLVSGRHISYQILPLSFREYLSFDGVVVESKKDMVLQQKKLYKKFDAYMALGGFPEVVITQNGELLKNYFNDIIQKDIVMRHAIRDKEALEKMAVYLMSNSSKILSVEALKESLNLSFSAASSYLGYLKDSFLVFELSQFSFSLKKQNKAMKKVYAIDTGLANNVAFKFSEDKGRALENIVFLELKRRGLDIFYFKTEDNLEVDFLVRERNAPKILLQTCWDLGDAHTRARELKALSSAMRETGLREGIIVTYNEKETIEFASGTINIIPVCEWLLSVF